MLAEWKSRRRRMARLVEQVSLVQLGSLEAGWRLPAKRCGNWRTGFVLGAGADPTFPLALLRCSPAMTVHVFDAAFGRHAGGHLTVDAPSPQLRLHPTAVGPRSARPSGHSLESAMSDCARGRLDVLAIHETEAVGEIVGDVLDTDLNVGILALALNGVPEPHPLGGLVKDMDAAGYRVVHAAAQPTSWRMTFTTRALENGRRSVD